MKTEGRTGELHWTDTGGNAGRTVLLVHSLGTDSSLWARQVEPFSQVRRVITVDLPGHGSSTARDTEYTIEDLGADVLAVADAAGVERFDYCGISIGGQIGLWLAVEAPERVETLVAACTAARIGTSERWQQRIEAVEEVGMEGLLTTVVAGWFSPSFGDRDPDSLRSIQQVFTSVDPVGYTGCCAALRDADLTSRIAEISAPTLVVAGELDVSTPVSEAELLHEWIRGSRLQVIPGAAHLANLDRPEEFTAAVLGAWAEW